MDLKHELLFRAICAFEEGGEASFTAKDLSDFASANTITRYISALEEELQGGFRRLNKNGSYPRFKIENPLECPEFIFKKEFEIGYKCILLALYKAPMLEVTPTKMDKAKICGYSTAKKYLEKYNLLEDLKLYSTPIKKSILVNEKIIENNNGDLVYSTAKSEYKCQYCGETDPYKFEPNNHITCKYCINKLRYEKEHADLVTRLLNRSKDSAYRHGFEYNLTKEYIEDLLKQQNYKCFYTGELLEEGKNIFTQPSIDRIDSNKGYIKGNVVICTVIANTTKNDLTINNLYTLLHKFIDNEQKVKEKLGDTIKLQEQKVRY